MDNIFLNAQSFLIQVIFSLYILALLLRVILQWVGAKFYNPVSQFIVKITNPLVIPLRKFIAPWHGIDLATIALIIILELIKLILLNIVSPGPSLSFLGILIWAVADILSVIINIYFFAVIIMIVLSWVHVHYNAMIETISLIAEPVMRPARRILPPISGFDLSPILTIIVLKLIDIVLVEGLMQLAISVS